MEEHKLKVGPVELGIGGKYEWRPERWLFFFLLILVIGTLAFFHISFKFFSVDGILVIISTLLLGIGSSDVEWGEK